MAVDESRAKLLRACLRQRTMAHVWEPIKEDLPALKPRIERLKIEPETDSNATNQ
jgi:uncharacterized protein with HEPN domain